MQAKSARLINGRRRWCGNERPGPVSPVFFPFSFLSFPQLQRQGQGYGKGDKKQLAKIEEQAEISRRRTGESESIVIASA